MSSATSTIIRRTLMCRGREAVRFSYDLTLQRVVGKPAVIDASYFPLGCLEPNGAFSTSRLQRWLSNRAVPTTRPGLAPVLQRLGMSNPEELLAAGLGLSLSNQYWLMPDDATLAWDNVNFFDTPFSPALGEALAPHDPDSGSVALARLDDEGIVTASSPDSALNGNLPKRWEIEDETRVLIKSGKATNLFQEPFNEHIATQLCARIMDVSDYVPIRSYATVTPRTCPRARAWSTAILSLFQQQTSSCLCRSKTTSRVSTRSPIAARRMASPTRGQLLNVCSWLTTSWRTSTAIGATSASSWIPKHAHGCAWRQSSTRENRFGVTERWQTISLPIICLIPCRSFETSANSLNDMRMISHGWTPMPSAGLRMRQPRHLPAAAPAPMSPVDSTAFMRPSNGISLRYARCNRAQNTRQNTS